MQNMKNISIHIPENRELPNEFLLFNPEEVYTTILIGTEAILKAKQKNKENIQNLETEYNNKINLLQKQIKPDSPKENDIFQKQQKQLDLLINAMKEKSSEIEHYKKLIETTTTKLDYFVNKSQPTLEENATKTEAIMASSLPSNNSTAVSNLVNISQKDKEKKFRSLAIQAFRDFPEFEIFDLHSVSGQGDFQLKFKDFSVLVDAKIYTNNVNCKAREKLKHELIHNDYCFFSWLVSMETNIDRFDKSSFMFEWLSAKKCAAYVNSLANYDQPIELLRSLYFTCQTIYNITNVDTNDITELHKLKDNEVRIRDISQKLIQNTLERDEIVNKMKENFQKSDEMIRALLNKETNEIVDKRFARIVDWWNFHIVNEEGHTMRSSNIWTMFKRDNPDLIGEIQANDFKDMIYTFISEDRISKPRNKFGALEIKNIRWKIDRGNAEH